MADPGGPMPEPELDPVAGAAVDAPSAPDAVRPRVSALAAFRAPVRDWGAAAGVGARPRECAQAGAHPGGRLQPRTAAAPADRRRHAPEPAGAGSFGHLRTDRAPDRALGASDGLLGLPMDAGGAGRLNRSSPSCLNRPAHRTAFFHGLLNQVWCQGSGENAAVAAVASILLAELARGKNPFTDAPADDC